MPLPTLTDAELSAKLTPLWAMDLTAAEASDKTGIPLALVIKTFDEWTTEFGQWLDNQEPLIRDSIFATF